MLKVSGYTSKKHGARIKIDGTLEEFEKAGLLDEVHESDGKRGVIRGTEQDMKPWVKAAEQANASQKEEDVNLLTDAKALGEVYGFDEDGLFRTMRAYDALSDMFGKKVTKSFLLNTCDLEWRWCNLYLGILHKYGWIDDDGKVTERGAHDAAEMRDFTEWMIKDNES